MARSSKTLGIAAALVVVIAVAAAAAVYTGMLGTARVRAEDLDRVLVVAASPNEDGEAVGQIIAIARVGSGTLEFEPLSPTRTVTIPGTSYSALGDAYPFGGGRGTAEALAQAEGDETLPYVAIDADQLAEAIRAAGGVRVTLAEPMSVFDGQRMYSFEAGEQHLSAEELQAVFKGAEYRTAALRKKLDAQLAAALFEALKASPETLDEADTNLDADALAKVKSAL